MISTLLDMTPEELAVAIQPLDGKKFRAKQIYQWLMKGAEWDEMSNIPHSLLAQLKEKFVLGKATIERKQISALDGTTKYLFRLHDDVIIESVVMHYSFGSTVCISTQAGCSMACSFCSSALDGKARDLTDGEMLAQVIGVMKDLGEQHSIRNIVLMGSGEPLDNYDYTVRFLRRVNAENGLNIGWRHISLSTCGLVKQMDRFTSEGIPVTLCLSMHAGNDVTRQKIMPIANKYTIAETLEAAQRYFNQTGRRIIIEYAMIQGVNDDEGNARDLAKALKSLNCHVNIIRLNQGRDELSSSKMPQIKSFTQILSRNGTSCTIRRTMGEDIDGACGQLRHKVMKSNELDV